MLALFPSGAMSGHTLFLRNVPEDLDTWLEESAHALRTSKTSFALSVLLDGMRKSETQPGQLPIEFTERKLPEPPPGLPPFTFIDLFAGIGGLRIGLERAGGRCLFSCEWDPKCQKTYSSWFGEVPAGDIREYSENRLAEIPDHDLLAAGFPCQPFSIAGVSKKKSLGRSHGFLDKAQGTLFFNLATIIEAKRPAVLLLENVKNLRSHDKGRTWQVIRTTLEDLGYVIFDRVLDAAGWVPQHRERVFIVGFDRSRFGDDIPFEFPAPPTGPAPRLRDILESEVDSRYRLSDHLWKYLQDYAEKHRKKGNGFGFGMANLDGVTRTLSARYFKDGSEILIPGRGNPRRLTPREAARLMGFPEELPIVVSDTQAYKQFGNSVVPKVAEAVAQSIGRVMAWQLLRQGDGTLLGRTDRSGRSEPARRRAG